MERLTVDGGEVWLGFARSRVKVLQNAGLTHTRQQFNMPDGATVVVELAGKDHTIRLTAGTGSIISGVVKEGKLIELPVPAGSPPGTKPKKVLREFKATVDAAKKVLKKPGMATKFGDVKELATPITTKKYFADPDELLSQAGVISASMYGGEMRKVIQILLGLKKQVEITYTYDFYDTYGVHKATDGSFWLIRIAKEHGVLAIPLGLVKAKKSKSACKAEQECEKVFKGVPTGKDFPEDIEKAITDKKVLRLATKDQISEFYQLAPYFYECGWSFNKDGAEAHNTGVRSANGGNSSAHYKITLSIDPRGASSATLSLVSSVVLHYQTNNSNGRPPFLIHHADGSPLSIFSSIPSYFTITAEAQQPCTILVYHDDDGKTHTLGYQLLQPINDAKNPTHANFATLYRSEVTLDGVGLGKFSDVLYPTTQGGGNYWDGWRDCELFFYIVKSVTTNLKYAYIDPWAPPEAPIDWQTGSLTHYILRGGIKYFRVDYKVSGLNRQQYVSNIVGTRDGYCYTRMEPAPIVIISPEYCTDYGSGPTLLEMYASYGVPPPPSVPKQTPSLPSGERPFYSMFLPGAKTTYTYIGVPSSASSGDRVENSPTLLEVPQAQSGNSTGQPPLSGYLSYPPDLLKGVPMEYDYGEHQLDKPVALRCATSCLGVPDFAARLTMAPVNRPLVKYVREPGESFRQDDTDKTTGFNFIGYTE